MLRTDRRISNPVNVRRGAAWSQLLVMVAGAALLALVFYPMLHSSSVSPGPGGEGSIKWQTSFPDALAQSRKTGKPVLLDFSASWCPPCQQMKREVWPDEAVGKAVVEKYIPVALDVDDHDTQMPGQKYGVQAIPTLVIVDADGNVLRQSTGGLSRDQLLQFLGRDNGGQAPTAQVK